MQPLTRDPLTRDQARARSALLTGPTSTSIELRLEADGFCSTTTLSCTAKASGTTFLECPGQVLELRIDGQPADPKTVVEGRLPIPVRQGTTHEFWVRSRCGYSSDGEAVHRHVDVADGQTYLYALSFLDAAHRWFACFDQPDLKTRVQLQVTTPDLDWIVRANSPIQQRDATTWCSEVSEPISTYLVSMVAGPYVSRTQTHDGVELELLARASLAERLARSSDEVFAVTAQSLDDYHRLFERRYPFGSYVQAFVPDFNAGAMENPGLVLVREELLFETDPTPMQRGSRASTIAHELAHQWFGNLVTMTWWDDLWLNESFAEYLAIRVLSDHVETGGLGFDLRLAFCVGRKGWGIEADQGPTSHPIAGNGARDVVEALAAFDGISYAKGAAVLGQLVQTVGDEAFWAGLRTHFERYAFANASASDLLASMELASGHDLQHWAEQWLYTQDLDRLRIEQASAGPTIKVVAPDEHPAERQHQITVGLFRHGARIAEQRCSVGAEPVQLGSVINHALAPGDWLVADSRDQSWAISEPPDDQVPPLAQFDEAIVRGVLLNTLVDHLRHGRLASVSAFDQVVRAAAVETEPVVAESLVQWARELGCVWLAPNQRPDAVARLAELAASLVAANPQSSPTEALGRLALPLLLATSSDRDLLAAVAEDQPVHGFVTGSQQRWAAVQRLQVLESDLELIERTLRRDPTSANQHRALTARTLAEGPEARLARLDDLFDPAASNYDRQAIASGLFHPLQTEQNRVLVEPWARALLQAAPGLQGWALTRLVQACFPLAHAFDPELVQVRDMLQGQGVPEALVRPLAEQCNRVEVIRAAAAC